MRRMPNELMTLPDRLDEIAGKLLATKDYSTFAHAIYQAAIELRSLQPEGGAIREAYANGYSTAIETAAQHVGWQHVVWDMTEIPPRELLTLLEKNIRALDGPPRPNAPTPQLEEE